MRAGGCVAGGRWPALRRSRGCGLDVQSADLFLLTRTGPGPRADPAGQRRRHDPLQRRHGRKPLPDPLLLQARDLADDSTPTPGAAAPPGAAPAASSATRSPPGRHDRVPRHARPPRHPELAQAELFAAPGGPAGLRAQRLRSLRLTAPLAAARYPSAARADRRRRQSLITTFQAIVLGVLQGITELFPISSLGHTVMFPNLFGWNNIVDWQSQPESPWLAFIVMLHVGSAIGLLIYFWRDWIAIITAPSSPRCGKRRDRDARPSGSPG